MTGFADCARFIRRETAPETPPLVPEIRLHLAGAVTPLWQATETELAKEGLDPPFWAFAWPGGQAVARYLLDHRARVKGRSVLDFAAGSGLGAIAAARCGAASVVASDIDPFAVAAITLNAALNGVAITATQEDQLALPPGAHQLILAGDVCYERPMAERALTWLRAAAAAGAEIILGDPGRAYLPESGLEELARYQVPTSLDLEKSTRMETVVYRLMG
jgi:predicted nicotinamide N-methyase